MMKYKSVVENYEKWKNSEPECPFPNGPYLYFDNDGLNVSVGSPYDIDFMVTDDNAIKLLKWLKNPIGKIVVNGTIDGTKITGTIEKKELPIYNGYRWQINGDIFLLYQNNYGQKCGERFFTLDYLQMCKNYIIKNDKKCSAEHFYEYRFDVVKWLERMLSPC